MLQALETNAQRSAVTAAEKTHLGRIEKKIDTMNECLFDPDKGLYSRVNRNTAWRKGGQWLLGILLSANLIAIITLMIRGG